jgi:molecular chaperone GrpE
MSAQNSPNTPSPSAAEGREPAASSATPTLDAAANAPADARAAAEPAASPNADLEARHAELSDAFLRAKAETENIRRRAEDEVAKARKYAVESFAESMLPVKDSLEAAISIPQATTEQMLEGVHATLRQLSAALVRNKVLEINPAPASKFDPHQHQAISVVPAAQEPNTVVAVLQKGYMIADRVLRPALVTVSASA